eukprot:gnl/TRDRNA2_/TRDRNA2_124669_c0_seq1.p1 gnl/TRDRNA2_/TRDRNA2_124669_c0~~gnl/TRDRNA2_/TRDRNA2_124669_c0_seq1.p1  ORF type:complete len:187 (-),score=6.56 gnl/TRDRNA2_/TRDRNA2_124669_c0_seq1:78-608(-)
MSTVDKVTAEVATSLNRCSACALASLSVMVIGFYNQHIAAYGFYGHYFAMFYQFVHLVTKKCIWCWPPCSTTVCTLVPLTACAAFAIRAGLLELSLTETTIPTTTTMTTTKLPTSTTWCSPWKDDNPVLLTRIYVETTSIPAALVGLIAGGVVAFAALRSHRGRAWSNEPILAISD